MTSEEDSYEECCYFDDDNNTNKRLTRVFNPDEIHYVRSAKDMDDLDLLNDGARSDKITSEGLEEILENVSSSESEHEEIPALGNFKKTVARQEKNKAVEVKVEKVLKKNKNLKEPSPIPETGPVSITEKEQETKKLAKPKSKLKGSKPTSPKQVTVTVENDLKKNEEELKRPIKSKGKTKPPKPTSPIHFEMIMEEEQEIHKQVKAEKGKKGNAAQAVEVDGNEPTNAKRPIKEKPNKSNRDRKEEIAIEPSLGIEDKLGELKIDNTPVEDSNTKKLTKKTKGKEGEKKTEEDQNIKLNKGKERKIAMEEKENNKKDISEDKKTDERVLRSTRTRQKNDLSNEDSKLEKTGKGIRNDKQVTENSDESDTKTKKKTKSQPKPKVAMKNNQKSGVEKENKVPRKKKNGNINNATSKE